MRDDLTALTPRLRRYARALISGDAGSSDAADTLVHATLMRAMGARGLGSLDLPVRLFATVTQLHRDRAAEERSSEVAVGGARRSPPSSGSVAPANRLAAALLRLPLEEREALLLVTLEGFDHATAARILRLSRPVLIERLTRARTALQRDVADAPVPAKSAATRASHLRLVVG